MLAAHEGLVDSELTLGRHADVLAHLVELVARYPLRERFRAQLIIALYRSGRQADALQAYRDARAAPARRARAGSRARAAGASSGRSWPTTRRSPRRSPSTPIAPAGPVLPSPLTSFVGRHASWPPCPTPWRRPG